MQTGLYDCKRWQANNSILSFGVSISLPNQTLVLQTAPACLFSYCNFCLSYVHRTGLTVADIACLHYNPFLITLMLAETSGLPLQYLQRLCWPLFSVVTVFTMTSLDCWIMTSVLYWIFQFPMIMKFQTGLPELQTKSVQDDFFLNMSILIYDDLKNYSTCLSWEMHLA